MNADEFVVVLTRLADTAEADSGAAGSLLHEELGCPRREPARKQLAHVVDDLVWRYDCTALQVGNVRFVSAPRPHWAGQVVGFWEGELVVTEADGKVSIFEHERFGERLLTCAVDGARFLEGLSTFLGMMFERSRWLERTDEAARVCAERAGGPECEQFYLGMLGYLEYGAAHAD